MDAEYAFTASAADIYLRISSNHSSNAIELRDGGRAKLTAENSVSIKATGTAGQQYAVAAYKGSDRSAILDIDAPVIELASSLTVANAKPADGTDNSMREAAYVIRTQGGDGSGSDPHINIGTDGADLIKLNAEIKGVGNAGGLRGEKYGEISIGTPDKSIISFNVKASENDAGKNGFQGADTNASRQQFDAAGLFFGGGNSSLSLQGKLIDVNVDGGSIRARGFRIDKGGSLNIDAPLLMTVTSSFAPHQNYFEDLGRKNDGLVIGMNENGMGTNATFNKPVTVIMTNNGNHSDNPDEDYLKGLATALFVESSCTVNFNADTLLMAGNDPGSGVLKEIASLRSAAEKDLSQYDKLIALTGKIDPSLRDQFYKLNISQGIRIGDDANINFNSGESIIVAKQMFQKRKEENVGTGAVNIGSGAKLTLTTSDISVGRVNVADGGVLNTTSDEMHVIKVGKINNSGIVAAENFIIGDTSADKLSGEVNQNAGLMTVNHLVVNSNGRLTVNGGTLSIAQTLKNAEGTISLKKGSEVIISSDAVGLTDKNGNVDHSKWKLPTDIKAIANSGGIVTINISNEITKLSVGDYNSLKNKIFNQMMTNGSTGSIRLGNYELENFTYNKLNDLLKDWDPNKNPEEFSNQTIENVDGGLYGSWQGVTLKQGNHEVTLDGDLKFSGKKPVVKADGSIGGVNTGNKTFTATGDAELTHVTDGGSGQGKFVVEGHSTVNDINIGTLKVANGASIAADTLNVRVATVDGNSNIGHLGSGILFADPPLVDGRLSFADASRHAVRSVGFAATIEAGQGSIWAIGEGATLADAENALRTFGFEELNADGVTAAAYVSTAGTYQGTLLVTGRTDEAQASDVTAGGKADTRQVYVAEHGGLLIDASKNDGFTPIFSGDITFEEDSFIGLVNVADDFYVQLTDEQATITNNGAVIKTDNPYVVAEPNFLGNGYGTSLTARIDNAGLARTVSSMGIHSVARRTDSRMAGLIADRAADQTALDGGLNLWVDASGERYRSNEFAGTSKFRADLAYAAFGGDIRVTDGVRLGLAVGHTDGSVRSEGLKNSVGGCLVSAYGMADVTDSLRAVADVTYTSTENEVRSEKRKVLNNDIDAQVFSAGFELQMPFSFGAFDLTPGVGLRVSRIESDSFKVGAVKINKGEMNLVQVPLTLRAKTDALEAAGWTFTPNAKIAFTPSFGDRSVEVRTVDQTVLDMSPFEADFGLTATKGGFSLGAALTTGAGQHGSCSIGGSIRIGYTF